MIAIIAAFGIMVLLSLFMLIFIWRIGERVGRNLSELKLRAEEGNAQLAECLRGKIPSSQVEEFGLAGAEDRKWIAYALFRSRRLEPSTEQGFHLSEIIKWLINTLAVLGGLALVWGIARLVLGVYEAGTALLFCVILASIMAGILLQVKKQRLMWKEEAEVLERALAQAGDTVTEDEKFKGEQDGYNG